MKKTHYFIRKTIFMIVIGFSSFILSTACERKDEIVKEETTLVSMEKARLIAEKANWLYEAEASNKARTKPKKIKTEKELKENGQTYMYVQDITTNYIPLDPPYDFQTSITTQVGPLLKTNWGQFGVYNDLVPFVCGTDRAPTGCVATSVAQIAKYWSPTNPNPDNFNWANMPNDGEGNLEIARLMAIAGALVVTNYKCTGSSANPENIPSAFALWGYRSRGTYSNYNYNTVVSEISVNRPILLGGCNTKHWLFGEWIPSECHEWVADGVRTYQTCSLTYMYFHMNWGWDGGSDNGWYAYNNWLIISDGDNYQYAQDMVYNIQP